MIRLIESDHALQMVRPFGDDVKDEIKVLPGHAIQYTLGVFFSSDLYDKINLLHRFSDPAIGSIRAASSNRAQILINSVILVMDILVFADHLFFV